MALFGTIAITDFGWYEFLSQRAQREEVNFWTPSSYWTFRAPEFSPFLFKLKAPHNAIAGFGFFARYSPLPDWLAWDCFTEGNGCSTFNQMKERISKIRHRFQFVEESGISQIGCIIVVKVTFFPREAWISQPKDWPVRTLRPTRYDLAVGEGKRVWDACLERASTQMPSADPKEPVCAHAPAERYGSPILIQPRLGQGAFRVAVTDAYHRACAVTSEHSLPALEAAHIQPFAQDGPHEIKNGLLLRADFHRLFEQGYLTVNTENCLEVSKRLRLDYDNGHSYYPLHGKAIATPSATEQKPSAEYLQWHNENVFLG